MYHYGTFSLLKVDDFFAHYVTYQNDGIVKIWYYVNLLSCWIVDTTEESVAYLNSCTFSQIVSLFGEALAWCILLVMIGLETKIYIYELRWYVRFGIIYLLIGEAVKLNLLFPMREYYNRSVFLLFTWLITTCLLEVFIISYSWNRLVIKLILHTLMYIRYIYVCIHIHTFVYIYLYLYMYMWMCVCIYEYTYTCIVSESI